MIFSRFRNKKTWQSKDSNTRISAINNDLNGTIEDQKAILFTMLNEDESELVRRAVLLKLNEFSIWLLASKDNNNNNVREYAEKEVEAIILNNRDLKLSDDEKLSFIKLEAKTSLLESWLKIESTADIVIALFKKIAKPQLLLTTFKNNPDSKVQEYLINQENQVVALDKLLKKSTLPEITSLLTDKINGLNELNEKPNKITKQTQLVLAKLLALKDVNDYSVFISKQSELDQQWQSVLVEFDCLTNDQQQTFTSKYQDIRLQLNKIFATKAEAFEQQKIADKLALEKQNNINKIEEQFQQLEQCLSDSIFESNQIDEELFNQQLAQIQKDISNSLVDQKLLQRFSNQVNLIEKKRSQLPEIAESLTEATHLISKMSQMPLPEKLEQLIEQEGIYQQWLKQWDFINKKSNGCLPQSIVNSYHEIVTLWNKALKPLHQEQNQHFHQIQRKLGDFKRLVDSGKYNASFGVFKKIKNSYSQLNTQQQHRIQRDFDAAQEKITELSDWEHYIATPRKKTLLEKINQLVQVPLDNPSEQAAKVKEYRSSWNSLGHADDEVEKKLNEEFNLACEKAFAPCRLFYAEQEKIREQHLIKRLSIIEDTKKFATNFSNNEEVNWKSLDGKLNQLKQKWRDAGEVERSKYKELNEQLNSLLKPIKLAIHQHHQENSDAKLSLIKQAEKALVQEDIQFSVNEIKKLQSQWRDIGYSGPKDENKLWQQFRTINDQVFDRRNIEQNNQKEQQAQLINEYTEVIDTIEKNVLADKTLKSLKAGIDNLQQQKIKLSDENIAVKSIYIHIERLTEKFNKEILTLKEHELNNAWEQVFLSLIDSVEMGITSSEHYQQLPKHWQKKLSLLSSKESNFNKRADKTIELEILAKRDSPIEEKERRLAIQIQLMQSHMASGNQFNIEDSFFEWLNLGQLEVEDLPLLDRVKKAIIK